MKKIKCPYAIKVLEERLTTERKWLEKFKTPTEHKQWQETNINSCEHRINELIETIKHLNDTI